MTAAMEGDVAITLSAVATYTKPTAQADYAWRGNEAALPPAIRALADELTRVPTAAAICLEEAGGSWLLVARAMSKDAAGRPFLVVDVCRLSSPSPPLPVLRLLIAGQAPLWPQTLDAAPQTIPIRPAPDAPPAVTSDDLLRARLGVPISTSAAVAIAISRREPFRYAGICYMSKPLDGGRVAWRPSHRGLLCVNCAEPAADHELMADLQYVIQSPLSEEQWAVLDRMDAAAATAAIRWLRTNYTEALPAGAAPELQQFAVVTLARWSKPGPALIDELVRRLGGDLSRDALATATGPLSPPALALLERMLAGGGAEGLSDELIELAARGFLQGVESLLTHKWLTESTARDPDIIEAAMTRMQKNGIAFPVARFLLDVETGPPGSLSAAEMAAAMARIDLPSLPPPRRRFRELLERAGTPEDIRLLDVIGRRFGADLAAMVDIARDALPVSADLAADDIVVALRAHARVHPHSRAMLHYVGGLLGAGRGDEALQLLEVTRGTALQLTTEHETVVRSRLSVGPPLSVAVISAVQDVIEEGIVWPEDFVPETSDTLRELARQWPTTAWIADMLDGRALTQPPATGVPAVWRPILRSLVTGRRAAQWMEQASEREREWLRRWIAELHGVDAGAWCAFLDGAAAPNIDAAFLAEFLVPLAIDRDRAMRLRILQSLAQSRMLLHEEDLARSCAGLAGDGVAQLDFVAYLLCGVGPMPLLAGVPSDLLLIALPIVPVEQLITRLMLLDEFSYDASPELPRRIALRVRETAARLPHRFSRLQIGRHLPLAVALSSEPGWSSLAVDRATRETMVRLYRRQLGLDEVEATLEGEIHVEPA